MVSFFGIKFGGGGDKKKQIKKVDIQPDLRGENRKTMIRGQQLGAANFSRPGRPKSRAGTSHSIYAPPTDWRAPYMMGAGAAEGATSSMVDLSAPFRAPGLGNLKQASSDVNLKQTITRWGSSSTAHSANTPPAPLGASGTGSGTPNMSTTGSKKDGMKPLDVSLTRESGSRPGTPTSMHINSAKSPLAQFEFGLGEAPTIRKVDEDESIVSGAFPPVAVNDLHGYPSPPQSIDASERSFSPVNPDAGRIRAAPNALRRAETAPTNGRSLPSPVASIVRTSEDRYDGPVIKHVSAKRDTMRMESPRRRSFTMELDHGYKNEHGPKGDTESQQQQEGIVVGNIGAFDFGESVRKSSVVGSAMDRGSGQSQKSASSKTTGRSESPRLPQVRAQSPLRTENPLRAESPLELRKASMDERRTAKERGMIEPMTNTMSDDDERDEPRQGRTAITAFDRPYPAPQIALPAPPTIAQRRTGRPAAAAGIHPGNSSKPGWTTGAKTEGDAQSTSARDPSSQQSSRDWAESEAIRPLDTSAALDAPSTKPRPRTESNASAAPPSASLKQSTQTVAETLARVDSDTLVDEPADPEAAKSSARDDSTSTRGRSIDPAPEKTSRARAKSEVPPPRFSSFLLSGSKPSAAADPLPSTSITTSDRSVPPPRPAREPLPVAEQPFDRSAITATPSTADITSSESRHTVYGNVRSPYGPPPEQDSYMRPSGAAPRLPPTSPQGTSSQAKTKGLPRGRRIEPPAFPSKKESAVNDNKSGGQSLPWNPDSFSQDPHHSAMVLPLTPLGSSTPGSSTAPRLPSPEFPSLERSLSAADDWSKSFEVDFDKALSSPAFTSQWGSPTSVTSAKRVEAVKAPPRGAGPVMKVGSEKDREKIAMAEFGMGNSTSAAKEFEAGFV